MTCSVLELQEKFEGREDFLLLDVRTAPEREIAKLDPSKHIVLQQLPQALESLEPWRDTEIICLCHYGVRSGIAQRFLLDNGFKNVLNLTGGIHEYALTADPSVAIYD